MASRRNQRSVKNDSAATRTSAHKLGRPVSTWSIPATKITTSTRLGFYQVRQENLANKPPGKHIVFR